jgi:hypothetical protein
LGNDNRLRNILDAVLCYERGEWTAFQQYASRCGINTLEAPDAYFESVTWTKEIFK